MPPWQEYKPLLYLGNHHVWAGRSMGWDYAGKEKEWAALVSRHLCVVQWARLCPIPGGKGQWDTRGCKLHSQQHLPDFLTFVARNMRTDFKDTNQYSDNRLVYSNCTRPYWSHVWLKKMRWPALQKVWLTRLLTEVTEISDAQLTLPSQRIFSIKEINCSHISVCKTISLMAKK